jgi:hypothetical protein
MQIVANTDSTGSTSTSPYKTSSHIYYTKEFTAVTTLQHNYAYIPHLKHNNGDKPIQSKTCVFINGFTVNNLYPLIYIQQSDM